MACSVIDYVSLSSALSLRNALGSGVSFVQRVNLGHQLPLLHSINKMSLRSETSSTLGGGRAPSPIAAAELCAAEEEVQHDLFSTSSSIYGGRKMRSVGREGEVVGREGADVSSAASVSAPALLPAGTSSSSELFLAGNLPEQDVEPSIQVVERTVEGREGGDVSIALAPMEREGPHGRSPPSPTDELLSLPRTVEWAIYFALVGGLAFG